MSRSVAWLTPFSRASDVSAFSRNLLVEFEASAESMGASPSIMVNENGPSYWSSLPQIPLSGTDLDIEILSGFEFCIYNIGNNRENHQNINKLALKVPGIVVIHDLVMQHYFANLLFDMTRRRDVYAEMMAEYYGKTGIDVVSLSQICSVVHDPVYAPWDTQHATRFPLIEPFAETAAALVVHSAFAENIIRPLTSAPVLRLQLPWDQKQYLSDQELEEWHFRTRVVKACSIMCFGHIGRAKCLELVIKAFDRSVFLCNHARLIIAGYPGDQTYLEELQNLVFNLGLTSKIRFELSVSDDRLLELKKEADIFVNLRFPNTESASGSLIEQMNAGKPVLIYATASYAEVSADAAVAVERQNGVQSVVDALEQLVADPERRISIGHNGLKFVRRVGRKEYVAQLWDFMLDHQKVLRHRKMCAVSRRLGALPNRELVGEHWLQGVKRTRRLMSLADSSRYVIDAQIFERWPPNLIVSFIATGLFGQLPNSSLEQLVRELIAIYPRVLLYRALVSAHVLYLFVQGGPDTISEPSNIFSAPMLDPLTWTILNALGSNVFARGCYIYLLGRMPYPGEAEKCIADLERSSSFKTLCEFIDSLEFGAREVAHSELVLLRRWAEQGRIPDSPAPRLDLAQPTRFSCNQPDVMQYLMSGWHEPEMDGVWSTWPRSAIRFRMPTLEDGGPLALSIRGRIARSENEEERKFLVYVNGTLLVSVKIVDTHWFEMSVSIPRVGSDQDSLTLEFDCEKTVNFSSLGEGIDTRDLGFLLGEICVIRPD